VKCGGLAKDGCGGARSWITHAKSEEEEHDLSEG
jgi:hypothetical protein